MGIQWLWSERGSDNDVISLSHKEFPVSVTSEPEEYKHYLTSTEVIIALVFIYLMDLAIIIGNSLVITAFVQDKQLRITRNYYIFNLAVANLVVGVFVIPIYSSTVITGEQLFHTIIYNR